MEVQALQHCEEVENIFFIYQRFCLCNILGSNTFLEFIKMLEKNEHCKSLGLLRRRNIMLDYYGIDKHIKVMCIIGGVMSLSSLLFVPLYRVVAIIMLLVIPLGCCLLFWITEHPAFGIIYTALFFLNRISAFFIGGGTFLATIIITSLLIYFIYVDCICIFKRRELSKREVEEMIKRYEESKNGRGADHEENNQLFNWPEN